MKPSKKDGIYRPVGAETLSRWMRTVMDMCGVPKHFKGGSIRMAAASKALDDECDPRLVLMMKSGTRGAREVGLDRRDGTDLLLYIRRDGQRSSEDWEAELLGAEVLEDQHAGSGVTAKSAADELGTVGRTGPGGDTPQGPRLECELAKGERVVVGSRQPVLDDNRRIPCWFVDRVPRLRRSLLLDMSGSSEGEEQLKIVT